MAIAVTTRAYDNQRSGANTAESALTAQNVAARGVRRLFSLPVPNDQRGVEAQPLIVPNVRLADGSMHDVIYLASMANQVLAYDFGDGTLLWQRNLGRPVDRGSKLDGNSIDFFEINDHWGVLSTPVIDLDTATMYLVAWISQDGSAANTRHVAFAVSLRDGKDVAPPVDLEGATFDPGLGRPVQKFQSAIRKQRAALLLTSVGGVKTVFIAFGSVLETSTTATGWVIACSTNPFAVSAAWASTVGGHGAGIWQAGAGPAADPQGHIYAMTGNGNFDAVTDFGEAFVKLQYTPGSLNIIDWWAPWTDRVRTSRGSPRAFSVVHALPASLPRARATNFRHYVSAEGAMAALAPPAPGGAIPFDGGDMDLGSGGPIVVPSHQAVLGAGKDGVLYVVDQANMGKTSAADLEDGTGSTANYARLKSPPIFFTYYPDPGVIPSPAPQDVQGLNVFYASRTHHQHGSPLFWDSPDLGPLVYCWGENGNLRAWSLQANASLKYLACGAEAASAQSRVPYGGMPGGMLTLCANGSQPRSGLVWATIPYGDANQEVTSGRLLAYDATQFGTFGDGSKQIRVIWDSERWNLPFQFNKFNVPVVANGRLLVPTYGATVDVYGLA